MWPWSEDNSSTRQLCRRGFDERTMRCRRRKKHPGSSHLNSITLPIPSDSVPVHFYNAVSWYSVTLSETGTLQADTESTLTNIDTKIAIYNNEGALVTFNDDCGNEPNPYLSNVSAPGLLAGSYYIVVGFTGTTFSENFTITTNNIQPQNGVLLSVTFTPQPYSWELPTTLRGFALITPDPNWTIVSAPIGTTPEPPYPAVQYTNNDYIFSGNWTPGTYRYQTTFDLTGREAFQLKLSGDIAYGTSFKLILNGNIIGTGTGDEFGHFIAKKVGSTIISGSGLLYYNGGAPPPNSFTAGFIDGINMLVLETDPDKSVIKIDEFIIDYFGLPPPPSPPPPPPPLPFWQVTGSPSLHGATAGTPDPYWTIISAPAGLSTPFPAVSYGSFDFIWSGNGTNGIYRYQSTFDLSGNDLSGNIRLRISGQFGSSTSSSIFLNGNTIGVCGIYQFDYFTAKKKGSTIISGFGTAPYSLGVTPTNSYTAGFIEGVNTLVVELTGPSLMIIDSIIIDNAY